MTINLGLFASKGLFVFLVLFLVSCKKESPHKINVSVNDGLQWYKTETNHFEQSLLDVLAQLLQLKVEVLENGVTQGEAGSSLAALVHHMDKEMQKLMPVIENTKNIEELSGWRNYAKKMYDSYVQYSIDYLRMITEFNTRENQLVAIEDAYQATQTLIAYLEQEKEAIYD